MTATFVFLTTTGAGTWTVPTGCTSLTVHLIGAGGASTGSAGNSTYGGGGGQYATKTISVTPGDVLDFHVGIAGGASGTAGGTPSSPANCDTWFKTSSTVFAQGGGNAVNNIQGNGGFYDPSGAWVQRAGGGGSAFAGGTNGGGGGGAGGPDGIGGDGCAGSFPGGGAGGGANGGGNATGVVGPNGSTGGNNRLGSGGGLGGTGHSANGFTQPTAGQSGTNGGGGGGGGGLGFIGGGGEGGTYPGADAGHGSTDPIWTDGVDTYGPGGGGGGGGGDNENPFNGGSGGNGGQYGGGAGGYGYTIGAGSPVPGTPGQGLIVIEYTPNPDVIPEAARGHVYSRLTRKRL